MAELTTDQRLAARLTSVLAAAQQDSVTSNTNADAFRRNGRLDSAQVHVVLEQRADEQVERLAEVIEGLAAGTVRIVDERVIVEEIAAAVDTARLNPADGTPKRVAQLTLEAIKTRGALR